MDFRGLCVRWARENAFDFQTSQQNPEAYRKKP